MLKVTKQVSNTRFVKDEGAQVLVSPSEGLLRITKAAQDALGVTDINRIAVVEVELEDGTKTPAIYVSPWAHVKDKETGKLEKDEEGKDKIVMTNEDAPADYRAQGRKLGYPNGTSGNLQFSCTPSWNMLKGTQEGTRRWNIKGLVEGEENFKGEGGGVTVYALVEDEAGYTTKAEKDSAE